MTAFRMPDSYYEPPDVDEDRSPECEDGCGLDPAHKGDAPDSQCYTREDYEDDRAEARRERMKERDWCD